MKSVLLGCAAVASAQDLFLAAKPSRTATEADLARAQSRRQTGRVAGSSPEEIADKINRHVSNVTKQRACGDYSLEELNGLIRDMFPHLNEELSAIYSKQDGRSRRFGTLAEYERSWESDGENDEGTLREAKCAETVMLWAHHLSEGDKAAFGERELPTLPAYDDEKATSRVYTEALSCQTGHAMVTGGDGTSTHEWPDWPAELHYTAIGHGAYPFWWISTFTHEDDEAPMEVWWSETQGVEKFYHSMCAGTYAWMNGYACYHMMFSPTAAGKYNAYMYNEEASEGKSNAQGAECCISEPTSGGVGPSEVLAPSQGNFWNTFTDKGEVDFEGTYYQGKANYYVMTGVSEPVADFWYFTDLEGKPVQQGEGGTGPTDQGYPTSKGHTIWHDYDPSSLDSSAIDASVFEVPAYCLETTQACAFP